MSQEYSLRERSLGQRGGFLFSPNEGFDSSEGTDCVDADD